MGHTRDILWISAALGLGLAGCTSDEEEYDNPQVEPLCEAMIEAGCAASPSSLQSCQSDFAGAMMACPEEFEALIACAGDDPSVACYPGGIPVFDECMDETITAYMCLDG
jgi:hypothetical protein